MAILETHNKVEGGRGLYQSSVIPQRIKSVGRLTLDKAVKSRSHSSECHQVVWSCLDPLELRPARPGRIQMGFLALRCSLTEKPQGEGQGANK